EVARDLCQRTASKAMIGGTITQLGSSFVIAGEATNCRTGDTLDKLQVQASSKDDVVRALGSGAQKLRRDLGESLASIEKYDAPIQGATTRSLDALKSYSLGMATRRRQGDGPSLPFFRKAIEQDPDFALAHARLSTVLGNLGELEASVVEIKRAYELKDRVSEPERLYIEARYAGTVENSITKTIDTYQVWIQTYPKDFIPHTNLANAYAQRSDYQRAVDEFKIAIALAPDEPLPYGSLASAYVNLGNLDEAHRTIEAAIAHGMDSATVRAQLYVIACYKQDDADMARQVDASRKFADRFRMLPTEAVVATSRGQMTRARELATQYETESIAKTGLKGGAAGLWVGVAQVSARFGDRTAALAELHKSLALDRGINMLIAASATLMQLGDTADARKMLDEARRALPATPGPEVERTFTLLSVLIRVRGGDKNAIESIPPP